MKYLPITKKAGGKPAGRKMISVIGETKVMKIFALIVSIFTVCVSIFSLILAIWNHRCGALERKEADEQRKRCNDECQNSDNNT